MKTSPSRLATRAAILLGSLLVTGCQTTKTQPADPREVPDVAAPSDGALDTKGLSVATPGLVGNLTLNVPFSFVRPSEYCLDDGYVYQGAPARIGDLNVFVDRAVDALATKIVLARGKRRPSLLSALTKGERCPDDYGDDHAEMPQMRRDWLSPEGSFRPSRKRLRDLPCFEASEVVTIDLGREIGVTDEEITIMLQNPFDTALDAVKAQAHYEGGPGKPMPRFEAVTLQLPPGGTQKLTLPAIVEAGPAGSDEGEPRGSYQLASVDLRGWVGEVEIDARITASVPRSRRKPVRPKQR